MQNNEVSHYAIEQWEDFGPLLRNTISRRNLALGGNDVIFRGHARADWLLCSPLERSIYKPIPVGGYYEIQRKPDFEKSIVDHFRKLISGTPGIETDSLSDNELQALGRHHGLCTSLLDWTRSPYVAAYFAFMDAFESVNPNIRNGQYKDRIKLPDVPVVIWALTLSSKITDLDYLVVDEWRKDVFYRQRAQQGLFTRLTSPIFADVENYLKNNSMAHYLCRIDVPGSEAVKVLLDLDAMNINEASLFPDPHGAATRANLQLNWLMLTQLMHAKK